MNKLIIFILLSPLVILAGAGIGMVNGAPMMGMLWALFIWILVAVIDMNDPHSR